MTLPVAFPVYLNGLLSKIDPRWKLAALVTAATAVTLVRTPGPALAALAGALLIVALARLPIRWYLARVGGVVLLLALFLVFLPITDHGDEQRWLLGPVSLSPRGFT